jgi:hypothetical protein
MPQKAPCHVKALKDKSVSAIAIGDDFSIALGNTLTAETNKPLKQLQKINGSMHQRTERRLNLKKPGAKIYIKRMHKQSPSIREAFENPKTTRSA